MQAQYLKLSLVSAKYSKIPSIYQLCEMLQGMCIDQGLIEFSQSKNQQLVKEKWFRCFCRNLIAPGPFKVIFVLCHVIKNLLFNKIISQRQNLVKGVNGCEVAKQRNK